MAAGERRPWISLRYLTDWPILSIKKSAIGSWVYIFRIKGLENLSYSNEVRAIFAVKFNASDVFRFFFFRIFNFILLSVFTHFHNVVANLRRKCFQRPRTLLKGFLNRDDSLYCDPRYKNSSCSLAASSLVISLNNFSLYGILWAMLFGSLLYQPLDCAKEHVDHVASIYNYITQVLAWTDFNLSRPPAHPEYFEIYDLYIVK